MKIDGFDWDSGNREKCQSHGVPLSDIETLFSRPHVIAPDVKHSQEEERYIAIGRSAGERPLFIVFTTRRDGDALLVRPISARFMHTKEFTRYER